LTRTTTQMATGNGWMAEGEGGEGGGGMGVRGRRGMAASTLTAGVHTIDPREVATFEADAAFWWDEEVGPFAPLHTMNPVRCGFVRDVLVRHFDTTAAGAGYRGGVGFSGDGEGGGEDATTTTTAGTDTSASFSSVSSVSSSDSRRRPAASAAQPLAGLRLLDVGCGGGILCEALARMGADVTGIDAAPGNIAVATAHAALDPEVVPNP